MAFLKELPRYLICFDQLIVQLNVTPSSRVVILPKFAACSNSWNFAMVAFNIATCFLERAVILGADGIQSCNLGSK